MSQFTVPTVSTVPTVPTVSAVSAVLTVRYFAAAAQAAGRELDTFPSGSVESLDDLRTELISRYGEAMSTVLRSGSFLVGGTVRRDGGAISPPDVVSPSGVVSGGELVIDVLPPFAGG